MGKLVGVLVCVGGGGEGHRQADEGGQCGGISQLVNRERQAVLHCTKQRNISTERCLHLLHEGHPNKHTQGQKQDKAQMVNEIFSPQTR